LKKIVIMKGPLIDSSEGFILMGCLGILFPECAIEIRSYPPPNSPDEEIHFNCSQNQFAL